MNTPTIMPWERVGTIGTCHAMFYLNLLQSCRAMELWERGPQLDNWFVGASGRERQMVLERAGRDFLTWAHGGVVAGSLLTQWPAALCAVRS